jgi:copper chaperone CopZ
MKHLGLVLLGAAALVLGTIAWRAHEPSRARLIDEERGRDVPAQLSGAVPDGCVVRTLAVEGMCCQSCAPKVYLALAGTAGVREVAVDPILGRAQVVVERALDPARLAAAATFEDYSARVTD